MVKDSADLKVICCTEASDCCRPVQGDMAQRRKIEIDFLYLDLSVCTRCQGADNSLDEAIAEALRVLKATDVDVCITARETRGRESRLSFFRTTISHQIRRCISL